MSPETAGIVLASAFLHAAWNAMIKADKDTGTAGVVVLTLAGVLATAATLLTTSNPFPGDDGMGWTVLSGVFEATYFLSLMWCLQRGPLAQVYSFTRGGALLLVWPCSVLLLQEPLRPIHAAGGVAVLAGLLWTGYGKGVGAKGSTLAPLTICASSIAAYHLLYKQALSTGAQPIAVFALSIAIAVPANLACHRQKLRQRWKSLRWGRLLVASVMCTLSFVLTLVALQKAGAGWVMTLRNTSVLFALLFARAMGEPIPRPRAWGAVAISLGAVLLGWA